PGLGPHERLHQLLRRRTTGWHGRTDLARHLPPKVSDVLEGRRGKSVPEQVSRFRDTDLGRDRPIRCREEELADDEPVETVHLNLHAGNLFDATDRLPREHTKGEFLHPRREVVESTQEPVDRKAGGFYEIFDRHEPRTLVHDGQPGDAADGLVNLLELTGRNLFAAPYLDRVAADDVVARDQPRQ